MRKENNAIKWHIKTIRELNEMIIKDTITVKELSELMNDKKYNQLKRISNHKLILMILNYEAGINGLEDDMEEGFEGWD